MTLRRVSLREGADLDGFRQAARALVAAGVAPDQVVWTAEGAPVPLPWEENVPLPEKEGSAPPPLLLPRAVRDCIDEAVPHRDPERYALLYALIWRVLHGERGLPDVASDPLVHRLDLMRRSVRRDIHKMHAFLRFRRVDEAGAERFVAWFEPDHFILEAAAPFLSSASGRSSGRF